MAATRNNCVRKSLKPIIADICGELAVITSEVINNLTRCWVRKWMRRRDTHGASSTLLKELADEDAPEYRNCMRMSKEKFEILLNRISYKIARNDTVMRSALSPKIKLEITLTYLATGNSYRTLQRLFRVSTFAISTFIPEVCDDDI